VKHAFPFLSRTLSGQRERKMMLIININGNYKRKEEREEKNGISS